jgi:hypothetical protein
MKDEKIRNEREKIPDKETLEQEQDEIASIGETLEEADPEKKPQDDEEDLLYTHKTENRGGSIQWNSAFCRKTGR